MGFLLYTCNTLILLVCHQLTVNSLILVSSRKKSVDSSQQFKGAIVTKYIININILGFQSFLDFGIVESGFREIYMLIYMCVCVYVYTHRHTNIYLLNIYMKVKVTQSCPTL